MTRVDVRALLPLSSDEWLRAGAGLRSVLSSPAYIVVFVGAAFVWTAALTAVENYRLVWDVVLWGQQAPVARGQVLFGLLPLIGGPIDPVRELFVVLAGVLSGLLLAVLVYRVRRSGGVGGSGVGGVGLTLAAIGGGCGACGSAILAVAGLGTATGLAFLPFGGVELLVVSVVVLAVVTVRVAASVAPAGRSG